jgi:hypothetical protein
MKNSELLSNFWKEYSMEDKWKLMVKTNRLVSKCNELLPYGSLTINGENDMLCRILRYGFNEVVICVNISFENYYHLGSETIIDKIDGILYNRSIKKIID